MTVGKVRVEVMCPGCTRQWVVDFPITMQRTSFEVQVTARLPQIECKHCRRLVEIILIDPLEATP